MTDEPKPRREQRMAVPVQEYTAGLTTCGTCRAPVVRWVYPKTGRTQVLEVSSAKRSANGGTAAPYLLESHFAYCPRPRTKPTAQQRADARAVRDPWLTR